MSPRRSLHHRRVWQYDYSLISFFFSFILFFHFYVSEGKVPLVARDAFQSERAFSRVWRINTRPVPPKRIYARGRMLAGPRAYGFTDKSASGSRSFCFSRTLSRFQVRLAIADEERLAGSPPFVSPMHVSTHFILHVCARTCIHTQAYK